MASELYKRIAKLEAESKGAFGACWIVSASGQRDAHGAMLYAMDGRNDFIPAGTDLSPATHATWRERFDAYNAAGNFRVTGKLITIGAGKCDELDAPPEPQTEAPTWH